MPPISVGGGGGGGGAATNGTTYGLYSSLPAAGNSGARYVCSDGAVEFIDDGSEWRPLINGRRGKKVTAVSTWTAINAGGRATTNSDTGGAIYMNAANITTAEDLRILKKTSPAAPYTVTAHLRPTTHGGTYGGVGLVFRQASNGYVRAFGVIGGGFLNFIVRAYTANNNGVSPTFSTSADLTPPGTLGAPTFGLQNGLWLRIADDNVNQLFSWSGDGQNFTQIASVDRTTTLTADEYGFGVWNMSSGAQATYSSVLVSSLEVA
jgi:hypothetical protein